MLTRVAAVLLAIVAPVAPALLAVGSTAAIRAQGPAPSPPMGWSEWDSYGLTVTEADFRANAAVLAGLRQYGWQYAMLDAGWYMETPTGRKRQDKKYVADGGGRLMPAVNRFPSAADGAGFKPLAGWLHAQGLKLGIHVMLGIPRQAVEGNEAIAGSDFHASEAADMGKTCAWDGEFYAVKDNAAGQAWYDSIAKQYAGWGVDLIKLGCVADPGFRASEVRQMSEAIRRTGRPMVLSLSPGPLPPDEAGFVTRYAQMWRVAGEHWDMWRTPPGKNGFPIGLREEFDVLAQWARYVKTGSWMDADALPDGWLGPHPPVGEARRSRLTPDEERSQFTLWCFARAPLIEGANLTRLDALTRGLMTDRELIEIDQQARESQALSDLPARLADVRVWEARIERRGDARRYLAFFNVGDKPVQMEVAWSDLPLAGETHAIREVREGTQRAAAGKIKLALPPHGSVVYQVR